MRRFWSLLALSLPLMAVADYYPPSNSTPPTNPTAPATFDQQIATQTAQGLKIFNQVSYQNMSGNKMDFFDGDDSDNSNDTAKHIKIPGGHSSGGISGNQ
jgi:hypothetical protein